MFTLSPIEHIAPIRRFEIRQEVEPLLILEKVYPGSVKGRRSHLDFNLRIVLQPRLSFSFWVGKRV
jgi:hypothetical protein